MEATFCQSNKTWIALGFFDGVHLGHAALLRQVKKRAEESGADPAVLSFDVHPDTLVSGNPVLLLTDAAGRKELIGRLSGISNVIFLHFGKHTMNMPWESFASFLAEDLRAEGIVAGYDFTFGAGGEGNAEKLSAWCGEHGVACDIIPPVMMDGDVISSSRIRELLLAGDPETAARLLGHPHCLSDIVRPGYRIGRKMEAPTINMKIPEGVLIPKHGVYASRVILSDASEHNAVTNIGIRPTFESDDHVTVETHILHFSGNLYDCPARVDLYSFLRPERKFSGFAELSAQIREDAERAEKILQK